MQRLIVQFQIPDGPKPFDKILYKSREVSRHETIALRAWRVVTRRRGNEGDGQGNFSEETGRVTMSTRARCRRSLGLSVMPSPSSYRHAAGPAIIPRVVSRSALTSLPTPVPGNP